MTETVSNTNLFLSDNFFRLRVCWLFHQVIEYRATLDGMVHIEYGMEMRHHLMIRILKPVEAKDPQIG